MRQLLTFALCAVALCAAPGCKSVQLTPASLQLPLLQADTGLDAGYHLLAEAVIAYAPNFTATQKATVKSLMASLYKAVAAADAAEKINDATTLAAQFAAAQQLWGQVNALLPQASQVPVPATPAS